MADAEEIAERLAYEFLKMGRYGAASGPVEVPIPAGAAGAAVGDEVEEFTDRVEAFSGVQVQSVGYEDGAEEPKVHVYLTRGSAREIKSLPTQVDDVQIRVHKVGAITVRPEAAGTQTNRGNVFVRNTRICCGSSVAPTSERSAGTLGALVKLGGQPQVYLLSNNHVLAGCNHVPQNQPVLAPASMDGRPDAPAPREVGRHYAIGVLTSGDPIFVQPSVADVALARASNPGIISSWQGDNNNGFDTPAQFVEPQALMNVKKWGRTTGLTEGVVESRINTPMPVSYASKHFKGLVWFKDIWTIRAVGQQFAISGDSGSLVVLDDNSAALGLVFAATSSGDYGYMISMSTASAALGGGLGLVSQHGI